MVKDILNFSAEEIANVCIGNAMTNKDNEIKDLTAEQKWSGFCEDVSKAVRDSFRRWYGLWYTGDTAEWNHEAMERLMLSLALMGAKNAIPMLLELTQVKLRDAKTDEERAEAEKDVEFCNVLRYHCFEREGKPGFIFASILFDGIGCERDEERAVNMECDLLISKYEALSDEAKANMLEVRSRELGKGFRENLIPAVDALIGGDRVALYDALVNSQSKSKHFRVAEDLAGCIRLISDGKFRGLRK